jgi:putative hydrolase of the HAD superfamily
MARAVLFDLYNTLVRSAGPVRFERTCREMGAAVGADPADFHQLYRETNQERNRGVFGTTEETVRTMAIRLGASPGESQIKLACVIWERMHRETLWATPSTLSTLDELKAKGLRLGLVSNASEVTVLLWPKQPMSSRIKATGFSCYLGVVKPDPQIFKVVCEDLRVRPDQCVYVGDGEDGELHAAKALGMRAIRTTEHANSGPWPGETISKIGQLTGLLS